MSDTMPITVPTPITMPSNANKERRRLATNAPPAMRKVSRTRNKFMSLVPQRFDGIETSGPECRIGAEEHADQRGHGDAEENGGNADRCRQRADRSQRQGQADP